MGDDNGFVFVVVLGGIFLYSYLWSIGVMIIFIVGFVFGGYFVIVMDVNGCIVVDNVVIVFLFNLNVFL